MVSVLIESQKQYVDSEQVTQGCRRYKHTICSEADSFDHHSAASSDPRLQLLARLT